LQELLPHRFTRQLENIGQLRDGRRPMLLERNQNRAPAVRQLFNGKNGRLPLRFTQAAGRARNSDQITAAAVVVLAGPCP